MKYHYPFESILIRNRLGQGMKLFVYSFSITPDHVCVLVALPDDMHESLLAKNAEYIILQLRERFSRTVKTFSMIELCLDDAGREQWYGWQFNWVGNTPMEPQRYLLSQQKQQYYQNLILEFDQAAN